MRKSRSYIKKSKSSAPVTAALLASLVLSGPALAGKPASKGNGGSTQETTSTTSYPMSLTQENYAFRNLSGDNSCLGEDDKLRWEARGGLKPGESFSFTPQYPACRLAAAAITISLSWEGSVLKLSSNVPDQDLSSRDIEQVNKPIVAPVVGNTSQLCMFPKYRSDNTYYTITVTNTGNTTAQNIVLEGRSENDWASKFYNRCINADADADGWNDSFEHLLSNMLYPIGYIDGEYQPYILWGSNYLRAVASTSMVDDEIDSSPVDFNDDGKVDQQDREAIGWYVGEGNGIPLQSISPNPVDPEYIWKNIFEWRRYDLNGDGYVDQADLDIVTKLMSKPIPMLTDTIAPTARVLAPTETSSVNKGSYYQIKGHVWDNAAIERVEYLVDGKVICSAINPNPTFGSTSPFHACSWNVPKRQGTFALTIQVYDAAGNMASSAPTYVTSQ